MENYYNGKVIWITGASSGIGCAIAEKLSSCNSTIIISARRENELQNLKSRLSGKQAQFHVLAFDLYDLNSFKSLTDSIIQQFGRIDILFNNGGISQRSLALETGLETDRKLMEVNYFSNIYLSKCVLPYMLKQKFGHIAVTSSISGKFGFYYRSGYAASKHALHGFYESLYLENKDQGLYITMICPGSINTPIAQNALDKDGNSSGQQDERLEKGMDSRLCAVQIIKAVAAQKKEVLIGNEELIPVYLKRFFPALFWKIIVKVKPKK
ncbi:MAG: SDR family oxidoreductase [Bacteroidia bacterium]|nr:SDR family oxidoreductase [Bacteroidia bacterium]MCZ2247296.1 SDR family oxidoreductase [Bacteroidia bacterium]